MNTFIVREKISDHIVLLRLNRPEAYNACNFKLLEQLESQLDELASTEIRVLIITGTGKSFSAGGDLKEIQTFDPPMAQRFSFTGHRVLNKIEQFPMPVIAAINGYALGGGCEIAIACDLRYASFSARLGNPESNQRIGFHRKVDHRYRGQTNRVGE